LVCSGWPAISWGAGGAFPFLIELGFGRIAGGGDIDEGFGGFAGSGDISDLGCSFCSSCCAYLLPSGCRQREI
jgi:hypothetical protein